jgi:hypothetical protein
MMNQNPNFFRWNEKLNTLYICTVSFWVRVAELQKGLVYGCPLEDVITVHLRSSKTCSCRYWQVYVISCQHACKWWTCPCKSPIHFTCRGGDVIWREPLHLRGRRGSMIWSKRYWRHDLERASVRRTRRFLWRFWTLPRSYTVDKSSSQRSQMEGVTS